MKKVFFSLLITSTFFTHCKQAENPAAIKAISESFERAQIFAVGRNENIYASFEKKKSDPAVQRKVELWMPMAINVSKRSSLVTGFIESLKKAMSINEDVGVFTAKGNELYMVIAEYASTVADAISVDTFFQNPVFQQHLKKEVGGFKRIIAKRFGLLHQETPLTFITRFT